MTGSMLMVMILVPLVAGLLVLPFRKKTAGVKEGIALLATLGNLILAILLYGNQLTLDPDWAGFGLNFTLKLYHFSSFILVAAAGFGFLVTLYSVAFMRGKNYLNQYYGYLLITLGLANGAVLADNLVAMLFFWEGLLATLFGMIAIGRPGAYKTATKALIIAGVTDLCMMVGIGIVGWKANTLNMSVIAGHKLSVDSFILGLAFIMMMIGAISKAGSMPFHSWIPDAAVDSPLPFMAFLPASIEKLLGIYLLARITLDIFHVNPLSWASYTLMTVGSLTILLAVAMALVQKDYKRLLSYHAISQVGYMVLGVGTGLPIGIAGGLFHMINHAMYKSCLFLTGGAVEHRTGTTDLNKVSGLARKMPVTFACFFIAAAAISGVPPFNGFFSKELIYAGALESGTSGSIFYLAAIVGSFLTAASFLKLGHAAYFGKAREEHAQVKEAPAIMLVPMFIIAAGCVLFGVANQLPLATLIEPILGPERMAHHPHGFGGWHIDTFLVAMTGVALLGAVLNHIMGVRAGGSGLKASDHIHHAPVLSKIYDKAEKGRFDPYEIGLAIVNAFSAIGYWIDRAIDLVYEKLATGITLAFGSAISAAHSGGYATYVLWSLGGGVAILIYVIVKL